MDRQSVQDNCRITQNNTYRLYICELNTVSNDAHRFPRLASPSKKKQQFSLHLPELKMGVAYFLRQWVLFNMIFRDHYIILLYMPKCLQELLNG